MDYGTPEEFRAWLLRRQPYEIVGTSCSCNKCPFYNYLNDGGRLPPGVMVGSYNTFDLKSSMNPVGEHPEWVKRFITTLDGDPEPDDEVGAPVTQREALQVLDKVLDELGSH